MSWKACGLRGLIGTLGRGTEANFIFSVMCLEAAGEGEISVSFPGIFLDGRSPIPPRTATSSLLSWDPCWWCAAQSK